MPGRTQRLMLHALIDLSLGNDVTVVASPMTESVRIARRIVYMAKQLGIPCANVEPEQGYPRVQAREYRDVLPSPTPRTKVHVDHTARGERPRCLPDAVRTVEGL